MTRIVFSAIVISVHAALLPRPLYLPLCPEANPIALLIRDSSLAAVYPGGRNNASDLVDSIKAALLQAAMGSI
jgi:hypothetical protein